MANNLKETILSSRVGQIGALVFSVYTFAWAIVEPLGICWIDNNKGLWRIVLLSFAGIVSIILSIRLSRPLLDKMDADGPYQKLQESYASTGNPQITLLQDGNLGNVINIIGNYHNDELDWAIKNSAQKAKKLELIFTNQGQFYFYLRVGMLSQDGTSSTTRWIRFDSSISTPDVYVATSPELGVPYSSTPLNGFNKAVINITDAVRQSYGQGGWNYNKVMIFRIRCNNGTVKSVSFRK